MNKGNLKKEKRLGLKIANTELYKLYARNNQISTVQAIVNG